MHQSPDYSNFLDFPEPNKHRLNMFNQQKNQPTPTGVTKCQSEMALKTYYSIDLHMFLSFIFVYSYLHIKQRTAKHYTDRTWDI